MQLIKKNLVWILGAILVGIVLAFIVWTPKAGATYIPKVDEPNECVEVNAPDPINFSKKIGFITFSFQWQENPEGTWKLYKDIDPRGGHEYWVYAGDKVVENNCPDPELPDFCEEEGYQPYGPCEEEVTPTPEPKGNPSDERFAGSSTEAPAPRVCTIPFEVARTWYDNDGLHWANDAQGIQKFSITYGPDKDHLIYGIDNIPASSRGIAKPESDFKQTWFSVWTWKDGCANQSEPIDP